MEKYSKFRIYGNMLGTMHDVALFLSAFERNYNQLLIFDKLLSTSTPNCEKDSFLRKYYAYRDDLTNELRNFFYGSGFGMQFLVEERLIISSINFNSPGFWEVIGSMNPLNQLREYIQERHLRKKDIEFRELEKESKVLANEKNELENNMLRLEMTQKMINQLKEIGVSDREIANIVYDHYANLRLLDLHIKDERVTNMEILSDDEI